MPTIQKERSSNTLKPQLQIILNSFGNTQDATASETLCEIEHLEELLYQLCDYQDKFRHSNMPSLQNILSSAIAETITQTEEHFATLKTRAS